MSTARKKVPKVVWGEMRRIHFIGIGGIGMSGLARLMLHDKKVVTGSDLKPTHVTCGLEALDIKVFYGQIKENITEDIDVFIYSDAVKSDNLEYKAAKATKKPMLSYFEALGQIANQYYLIAVAGTHGKTTTTAMLIDIFEETGNDPTAIVGSLRGKSGSNFRGGKSKYFIVEADEYERHFLHFTPDVLVITNIEADHLDYYKNLADIQNTFQKLVGNINDGGILVCNPEDPNVAPVLEKFSGTVVDYTSYIDPLLNLKVIGEHNYQNAAAAAAAADAVGIKEADTKRSLEGFAGTWRRFEYRGDMPKGAKLYDDYAHHPTEIRATLKAAREHFRSKRIVVAFHPHLYSRTKLLFDDFAAAFRDADDVFIAPIFAAREKDDGTITHKMLAEGIKKQGTSAHACDSFDDIVERLRLQDGPNLVIITMGAGDIYTIAEKLL